MADQLKDMWWPAPAKLNLMLHITSRRPDGYHNLQTVFQLLDFCDELRFTVRDDGQIRRLNEVEGVPEEQDLVVRAAHALQLASGTSLGADIEVRKHIPMGGGLGGGSSDAATTLLALNHLWSAGLSREELMALGLKLGADVPVFVFGHSAWAEGVGELVEALELPEKWYVVIHPQVHISTARLFADERLTRNCEVIKVRDFKAGAATQNVFQPIAAMLYPEVKSALESVAAVDGAGLTGTGSCVYAGFASEAEARQFASGITEHPVYVVKALNQSPVEAMLQ